MVNAIASGLAILISPDVGSARCSMSLMLCSEFVEHDQGAFEQRIAVACRLLPPPRVDREGARRAHAPGRQQPQIPWEWTHRAALRPSPCCPAAQW